METKAQVVNQERIDDVPLLLGMMRQMNIASILDEHLGKHHLHRGLSLGNLAVGWIGYILSQSDHRKSAVQDWAIGLGHTLESHYGCALRPHEFSDDRLGILLDRLAAADWDAVETDLFHACFDVYEFPTHTFHIDATTSCGYHEVTPDGIMQLGHSKDHRPDLPQLKIMAAVTQPLAFPVATSVVSGERADDGLYWPTIVQVKEKLASTGKENTTSDGKEKANSTGNENTTSDGKKKLASDGLLFVGDCKMASLDIRVRIANAGDFYLTPLPNTGETAKNLGSWIETALLKDADGRLENIHKHYEKDGPILIAKAYEFTRTMQTSLDDKEITWTERVQVVQNLSQLECQKTKLEKHLQQAQEELARLTIGGKGHKVWRDEQELRLAIKAIEDKHNVGGLLVVTLKQEKVEKKTYGKAGRPSESSTATLKAEVRYKISEVSRNEEEIEAKKKRLGWRAIVTNASTEKLSLAGSVLTYREGGGMERPFHQLKDAPLGIKPLFVRLSEQVVGLTRLLLIALRVLTLIEIVVRAKLAKNGEKLENLHPGQKNKLEGNPTGKRLLRGIAALKLTLTEIEVCGERWWFLPPLPRLLVRVLDLLGLSASLYTSLTGPSPALVEGVSLASSG